MVGRRGEEEGGGYVGVWIVSVLFCRIFVFTPPLLLYININLTEAVLLVQPGAF